MDFTLNDMECRVLGCLIEKELTTPEYYPLTVNALVNACNQKSNRHPVVNYSEDEVLHTLDTLNQKDLTVRCTRSEYRVAKYIHRVKETLGIKDSHTCLLAVLLLRGPQTPGELRTRTQRMYGFDNLQEVETTVQQMIDRGNGALAVLLPRLPGQKEQRYMHLLAGEIVIDETLALDANEQAFQPVNRGTDRISELESGLSVLRQEFDKLVEEFRHFRKQFE